MEKAPRDSSCAKGLLVQHVSYDSNKSFICVYVCFLIQRERSMGHTPNGDQCSTLGMGMG